jgi:hypothetical protein
MLSDPFDLVWKENPSIRDNFLVLMVRNSRFLVLVQVGEVHVVAVEVRKKNQSPLEK